MKNIIIAPSVLSADFANLQKDVEMINQSEAKWIHVDVMDGVFVPNISFGFPVVEAISTHARLPLDVHLMIVQPERYIENFQKAGAANITVHIEACTHLHRVVQQIKSVGCKAGVAINPHTNVDQLDDIIQDIDIVLIMSVNPGFGGQSFIENTYSKVARTRNLIERKNSNALIEIDGGVNIDNAPKLMAEGASAFVAGNFIFKSENPLKTINDMNKKLQ